MLQLENFDTDKQISCVSHEIRNNISICDMYSQIIRKNLERDNILNSSIENALNCLQKSIQMISVNLLDLKSLNKNSPKIQNLESLLIKAIEFSKAYIEDKSINYKLDIKCNSEILVDENRFLSCIINILKNAIESISDIGEIHIETYKESYFSVIHISNNGIKIPDEIKDNIFKYGYTTKENGSGYGLYICKQYLESQNATLDLVRSDDEFTIFEIKIP